MSGPALRRVLVALDASGPSLAALDVATALAARIGAHVAALFVEDENLLRLAGLPRATAVASARGTPQVLDVASMTRALAALADEARRALETSAAERRVDATFDVRRGCVVPALLEAARGADLLVLGRRGSAPGHRRLGSVARALLECDASVLLVDAGEVLAPPFVAVFDGSAASVDALELALRIAGPAVGALAVVAIAGPSGDADVAAEAARTHLARVATPTVVVRPLRRRDAASIGAAARALGGRAVVAPAGLLVDGDRAEVVRALGGPVLLVRRRAADAP